VASPALRQNICTRSGGVKMASLAQPFPRTLSERRNDISTVETTGSLSELAPETFRNATVIITVVVDSRTRRGMTLSVPRFPVPRWFIPSLKACGPLLLLPLDWDRAGAPRIHVLAIQSAMDALWSFLEDRSSLPQWTPTPSGGVQLDWHEKGIDLEIEFPPDAAEGCVVFSDNRDREADWDGPVSVHLDQLQSIFKNRLVSDL
jgi:hypothetical protein